MATEREGAVTFLGNPLTLVGDEVKAGDPAPEFSALTGGAELAPYTQDDGRGHVRIFNVVVSLDTPVCDAQTRRFNDEAAKLEGVEIVTLSADLPFTQARWAKEAGISDRVRMVSDHRDLSFGTNYGFAVKELRLLGRGIVVLDADNRVAYAQYVPELTDHPDYEKALAAAQEAAGG
jgi:thiol peroxidase